MPSLFAERYSLNGSPRQGGMADVYQAFDTQRFQQVALKVFARGRLEDEILREAFDREIRALQELRHPGIVLLLDSGLDAVSGQHFLSLEWVPSDLSSLPRPVSKNWASFYSEIGRPILEALAYAHSRGVVHRDIKPQNVLMGADGPRLADFGISKLKHWLEPSITLNQFQSRPFAAPEQNDGAHEFTRDVFSFAAVAVQCLSNDLLLEYSDLQKGLEECALPADVADILRSCLSADPLDRLANAQAMLGELNALSQLGASSQPTVTFYFALSRNALDNLTQQDVGRTESTIVGELTADLSGLVAFERRPTIDSDSTPQFSLYGSHFSYHAAIDRRDAGQLRIINARKASVDALEGRREIALKVPVSARFSAPQDRSVAELALLKLQEDLDAHETLRNLKREQRQEDQLFGTWAKLLNLKEQLEQQKRDPLRYDSWSVEGNRLYFSLIDEPAANVVGQERRVDIGNGIVVAGEVQDIEGSRLTLRVDRGTIPSLPRSGELLLDDRAARKSIQRQRSALDAVRYGRSARKDLRQLLLNPQECRTSTFGADIVFKNEELDDAKREAVRKALSTRDLLVVEGPPGTGKTTFITELILQILSTTPTARILISSQTHVALDNVLEKLQAEDQDIKAIRVARAGNERVSKAVQSLLLDEQMERWAKQVIASSKKYLESWADAHGMSRHDFEVSQTLREIASLEVSLKEADEQYTHLAASALVRFSGGVSKVSEDAPDRDDAVEQLEAYRSDAEKLRRQRQKAIDALVVLEPDAAELVEKAGDELNEWAETYMPSSESASQFRRLLGLQNEWHTRLLRGSDFQAALIASSQVVAGTCIGLAAARGVVDAEFDYCIVDEASKATPTELLVPVSLGKRIVLVGDTKQLPPFIEDDLRDLLRKSEDPDLAAAGRETLFARMNDLLPTESKALLSQQHRMVPAIGDLISKCFYRETLSSAPKAWDPVLKVALPRPVTWLTTAARDDRAEQPVGSGYKNAAEARIIHDLLQQIEQILQRARRQLRTLVVTGYREQQVAIERFLSSSVEKLRWLEVEINTVDAVQGRQADLAIYSVVRSNPQRRLGFLRESKRLNVALSRGRQYLVIVGDHVFCREADGENPFYDVASYIESHKEDCQFLEAR